MGDEKSRRARNYEPQQVAFGHDEWFCGFASALAQIWNLHHDGQMVCHIMSATGINLTRLMEAGVDDLDLGTIQRAIDSRAVKKETE